MRSYKYKEKDGFVKKTSENIASIHPFTFIAAEASLAFPAFILAHYGSLQNHIIMAEALTIASLMIFSALIYGIAKLWSEGRFRRHLLSGRKKSQFSVHVPDKLKYGYYLAIVFAFLSFCFLGFSLGSALMIKKNLSADAVSASQGWFAHPSHAIASAIYSTIAFSVFIALAIFLKHLGTQKGSAKNSEGEKKDYNVDEKKLLKEANLCSLTALSKTNVIAFAPVFVIGILAAYWIHGLDGINLFKQHAALISYAVLILLATLCVVVPKFLKANRSFITMTRVIGNKGASYSPGYLKNISDLINSPDRSYIFKNILFIFGILTLGIAIGVSMTANPVDAVIATVIASVIFCVAGLFADCYISRVEKFVKEGGKVYGVKQNGENDNKIDDEKEINLINFQPQN